MNILKLEEISGQIPPNSAIFGECLQAMSFIPDQSIHLILCDLPYGTTQNKWDCQLDLNSLWSQYKRIIKPNGAILLNAQTPFDKVLGASNLEMLRYEWIWQKSKATGHLNANKMPMKQHENILVFYKSLPTYNPQGMVEGVFDNNNRPAKNRTGDKNYGKERQTAEPTNKGNFPKSIQFFSNPSNEGHLHPTMKPLSMMEYFIKTYTNEGDIVLDNCAGSFTVAVAATNLNRQWICMENDEKYYNIGVKRTLDNINSRNSFL